MPFTLQDTLNIHTLGQLRIAGYVSRSVKEELRNNLLHAIKNGQNPFTGIHGYENTVIPDVERAILSRHNMILLGLRGQAKTRIARQMVELLDEYIPVVQGSEINDDPLQPLSRYAIDLVHEMGDLTPISWVHRSARYGEKLATPDVTVADLIGDVDPIKAATQKLTYADERVLHFGLIPRCHRGIFVINELPDLQARIQVALFNILQEGDIQIRGFKLRFPLDIEFVFTANPEDYTNRGSIVTPLKDRIESQILTHYPRNVAIARTITEQEAEILPEQLERVHIPDAAGDLIELIAMEARHNEFVDAKSGVSARLTITAYENIISQAELRVVRNAETTTYLRVSDFAGAVTAITGKIELVYEGEQEGPLLVAQSLLEKAIRTQFKQFFLIRICLNERRKKIHIISSGNGSMPAITSTCIL
jgi:magnesium chelatase subunit I